MPVTRKVLCHQQDTVHGLCPSGKGIRSCTQACHMVGSLEARHRGVAGVAHTEHVWKFQKQNACWLQPEWRAQCESGCSPRFLPEPPPVHHGSGSPLPRVSYRMSLGKPVCRWSGHHHWITGGTEREADPLWKTNIEGKGLWVNLDKTWYLGQGSMCSRSLAKTPVVSEAWSRYERCTGKARPIDGRLLWERSQWVGKSFRWCHPSVTLGTAYPQGTVVNSLVSQDVATHGTNSASFCPSSPPTHFPSPPEEEFTIHVSVMPTGSGDYTDILWWNDINN